MHEAITNNLDLWTSALLTKSTAGRSSNGKQEAYGIKKLRELILELAVRGKLVPQDPNDEPVRVLLEKIADERKRLVVGGKVNKQNPLPEITDDDRPYTLPPGWEWERLGNLFDVQDSRRIPVNSAERAMRDGPYPYYGANGQVGFIDDYLFEGKRILIAEDGGFFDDPIRGVAYVVDGKFWVNNHAHVLECLCDTNPKYWVSYLNRMDWKPLVRGMTRDKLNQAAMVQIVMAVPPLAEQQRIAAKVDELMALCGQLDQQQTHSIEAHQTLVEILLGTLTRVESPQELSEAWNRIASHFDILFTTEHSIDQLKQTILQLAVMGKLVPQDPNDEPASELLKKIAAEKARLAKEGKIKKEEPLPEIAEDENPFVLPEGWKWSRFGDLWVDSFYGPRFGKDEYVTHGGYPTIRTTDMTADGKINLKDPPEVIVDESKLSLYGLEMGDLLITRSGSIGTMAIYDLNMVAIPSAYLIRVRLSKPMLPEYTLLMLRSPLGQSYLGLNTTSVGVPNVNATKMARFVFAIPPEAEQHRIVAKVNELLALCDGLKARLNDAQTTQIHLADAIVEQAVA